MARIKSRVRRFFSLLLPLLFISAVHAEQTPVPAKTVTVEAKNETFAPQHPDQYLSWKATSEQSAREDALAEDPRLVILWAGYPFSRDYNKPRGHAYAVTDVRETLRTGAPKTAEDGPLPMACWSCKSPDVARLIQKDGEDGYFHGKWARGGPEIVNNLGCADCHNTASADFAKGKPELTLSRPYAERAMEAIGKPFEKAGRFDQQSMVCGQCHVEYYFDGKNKAVKFPWDDGMKVENMEKYYDTIAFSDWTNSLSKTPMLKAQPPEYETWSAGIHGKNNVTCIDCHMPKVKDKDGKVYTDHKIGNPFDQFDASCKTCHEQSKETLQKRVAEHKKQVKDAMIKLEDQLVKAHFEAKAAWDAGATQEEMQDILKAIRHAQWRWDYSAASHGGHMHAPDVMLRVLGSGLDKAADARAKLAAILTKHDVKTPVEVPDISTADKAWKVMGIDIEKERKAKKEFLETVVPQWVKEAKANGKLAEDTATKQ